MKIFICFTPLQALITKRIIELDKLQDILIIYFYDSDSNKNRYYFNQLERLAVSSYYIKLKKSFFIDIFSILKLSFYIKKSQYNIFYTGNIKSMYPRLLMYILGYKNYFTFDDGSGNVVHDGYFDLDSERKLSTFFFSLLAPSLLYKNIRKEKQRHFTIFNLPNAFPNTYLINLFQKNKDNSIIQKRKRVIMITNAFAEDGEMELKDEISLYNNVIEEFGVDEIIKHPREYLDKQIPENCSIVDTLKIAEEYILSLSDNYNIIVIGMYSTVLLNLGNVKNILKINICAKVKKAVNYQIEIMSKLEIEIVNR